MEAVTASSTWAVQMLLVARSRRMCCSRVCRARRRAGRPALSRDTPTMRPGNLRRCSSRAARKAACGPPKNSGTPKRCELPTTTSAPHAPGGRSSVKASRSLATTSRAPAACTRAATSSSSKSAPSLAGYWTRAPNTFSSQRNRCRSATTTSRPSGSARVLTTSMVCGWQWSATRKTLARGRRSSRRRHSVMASAAAVASSRREALATGMAVSSETMVWKLRSASRRPWAISAW